MGGRSIHAHKKMSCRLESCVLIFHAERTTTVLQFTLCTSEYFSISVLPLPATAADTGFYVRDGPLNTRSTQPKEPQQQQCSLHLPRSGAVSRKTDRRLFLAADQPTNQPTQKTKQALGDVRPAYLMQDLMLRHSEHAVWKMTASSNSRNSSFVSWSRSL